MKKVQSQKREDYKKQNSVRYKINMLLIEK